MAEYKKQNETSAKDIQADDLHEYKESEGYIIDAEGGRGEFKLARDGHTILIPQVHFH
jgi:hypothetical protein